MTTQSASISFAAGLFICIASTSNTFAGMPFLWAGPLPSDAALLTTSENATLQQPQAAWVFAQKDWNDIYRRSSVVRRGQIAERIGNQGTALYAKTEGLEPLLGSRNRGLRQGPDAVYRDPHTGFLVSIESKGGLSRPKTTSGYEQGTVENTIKSAERVLRSPLATPNERAAMSELLADAANGRLETRLVRTEHEVGAPKRPVLERRVQSSSGSTRLSRDSIDSLAKTHGESAEVQSLIRVRGSINAVVGGGMNGGFGILLLAESTNELYHIGRKGFTRANMPETGQQAALFAAGTSMVVSGGASISTVLTTESNQLQTLNSISRWGGRAGLVFVVASEGFVLWQYAEGHITREDAIRSTGRLAGTLVGAWAGANVGGAVGGLGGPFLPVTVPVGAAVGAIGGGLAGAYAADAVTDICLTYGDESRRREMLEFMTQHYSQ